MGKGSGRRPAQVKQLEFDENWGRAFGHRIRYEGDACRTCDGTGLVTLDDSLVTWPCPVCEPKREEKR